MGRLHNVQLHLAAAKVRECGGALVHMAGKLESGGAEAGRILLSRGVGLG